MSSSNTEEATAFLAGGGELGALIAAFDWSRTPLGPIAQWPAHKKVAVGMMLHCQAPIVMMWREAGVMIYNDAYAGSPGPGIRSCWAPRCARAGPRWPSSTTM